MPDRVELTVHEDEAAPPWSRTSTSSLVHSYGRVRVVDELRQGSTTGTGTPRREHLDEPTRTEELALAALRRREQPAFPVFSSRRNTEGRSWADLGISCGDVSDDAESLAAHVVADAATVLPAPQRLINRTATALVFVEGTQPDMRISDSERESVLAHWHEATRWISSVNPAARVSWRTQVYEATVDMTPWQGAAWPGLPDYDGFSAIVNNSHDGRIYVFEAAVRSNGSHPLPTYYRISNVSRGADSGYPRDISDGWTVPTEFASGVDASLWRESNQKMYLFRGDKYIRVTPELLSVDPGYPRDIADGWLDVPTEFAEGIDAAVGHKGNNSVYMFKGNQYIKFANGSSRMADGYPKSIADHWGGADQLGDFAKGIDAAFWRDSNAKIYFFRNSRFGGKYIRMDPQTFEVDSGYAGGRHLGLSKEDAESLWRDPALEQLGFAAGHDGGRRLAASLRDATRSDQAIVAYVTKLPTVHSAYAGGYRFTLSRSDLTADVARVMAHETLHLFGAKDEYLNTSSCTQEYGRFFRAKNTNSRACSSPPVNCIMDSDGPSMCEYTPLHVGWGAFESKIDAAVYRGDNGKSYLFSGEHYVRYSDIGAGTDPGYPRKIRAGFRGLPPEFTRDLDGALWREDNQCLYMFKDDKYVRFSPGSNTVDDHYPKDIAAGFKGLPFTFRSSLDCVLWRDSPDRMYVFKGTDYIRLAVVGGAVTVDQSPRRISSGWRGLDLTGGGVDAALMRRDTHQIYFFHGRSYTRFSTVSEGADPNYPRDIDGAWMPFPRD